MKIFDFNIHLAPLTGSAADRMRADSSMTTSDLAHAWTQQQKSLSASARGGNVMIFNPDLFFDAQEAEQFHEVRDNVATGFESYALTALINFRREGVEEAIERAYACGVRFLKVHSYVQHITAEDFPAVLQALQAGADCGMGICIDAAYGSADMYRCDNLRLAAEVSRNLPDVPIVLLHSGGARVMEAMLLADDNPHIYLETSFSIPYYWSSNLIADFAFAYKKCGADRVLYASDTPYVSQDRSLDFINQFFNQHGFSAEDRERILWSNAERLVSALAS